MGSSEAIIDDYVVDVVDVVGCGGVDVVASCC